MDFGHAFELEDTIFSDPCKYIVNMKAMAGLEPQYITRPRLLTECINQFITFLIAYTYGTLTWSVLLGSQKNFKKLGA